MQSAMASAERVFELLDSRPAIASPARPRAPGAVRGRDRVRPRLVRLQAARTACCATSRSRVEPGREDRDRRRHRLGQDDDHQAAQPLLRRAARPRPGRRRRRARVGPRRRCAATSASCCRTSSCSPARSPSNITLEPRRRHARAADRRARRRCTPTASSAACPRGYDEPVRERGNNLSTGQRQLLAFARALAYDPAILVLDEATSSVDTETELLIQDALATLLRGPHRARRSRTACRPSSTPTASSCCTTARSARAARTPSCSQRAASTTGSTSCSTRARDDAARRRRSRAAVSMSGAPARRPRRAAALRLLASCSSRGCAPATSLRAGYEEAQILWRREPIDEVLRAAGSRSRRRAPSSSWCSAVRALRRRRSSASTSAAATRRSRRSTPSQVVHVVTRRAARPRSSRYTWWFPIVGRVPYKGYFDRGRRRRARRRARARGLRHATCGPASPSARSAGSTIRCCRHLLRDDEARLAEIDHPRAAAQHALRARPGRLQRVVRDLRRPSRRERFFAARGDAGARRSMPRRAGPTR